MKRLHLKQRRGAIAVMTGLMFMALVMVMAIAVDFNRLWMVRNELQTSADAGALAGALQFLNSRDTLVITDSARAYARANPTLTDTVHVDSIQKGNWNANTKTFSTAVSPSNAVNVVVSYQPSGIWLRGFGSVIPRMKARAVAWASAPVANTGCQKPWAIPYEELMFKINSYRKDSLGDLSTDVNPPGSAANLSRNFDQVADINALTLMGPAARTFTLKLGGGTKNPYSTSTTGNFQAVQLGPELDPSGNAYPTPPTGGGAHEYKNNISGANGCYPLRVGDQLEPAGGGMTGATVQGSCDYTGPLNGMKTCSQPSVCGFLDANTGANFGNCYDASGVTSPDIKAAFFECNSVRCPGVTNNFVVKLLGSFSLKKVYPKNDTGSPKLYDIGQIVGEFKPIQSGGPAGGGSTTLQKLVLTK